MGCDGGTIPRRDELVRMKKKPEQKDKDSERSFKWRNCALSQQPLQAPVVACGLGRLYSKSSVIEALLDKDTKPESINHIKNLKDIKDLKLTKNPAYIESEHADGAVSDGTAPYICPISGLEMSGKFRFSFLWSCGCVLAERALKEVKQNVCHVCQAPFTNDDVIILNGTAEEVDALREKNALRVSSRKSSKKPKVDVKIEPATPSTSTSNDEPSTSSDVKTEDVKPETSAVKKESDTIPLTIPKFNPNKQVRGQFGTKRAMQKLDDPSYKKAKKDYSVAKDPQSSEVYKSLFTSHKSEKDQQRAHWVTYNPFYN